MRTGLRFKLLIGIFIMCSLMAVSVSQVLATDAVLTTDELQVLAVALREAASISNYAVIADSPDLFGFPSYNDGGKTVKKFREEAKPFDGDFKEALEDFFKKNTLDENIFQTNRLDKFLLPKNAPTNLVMISDTVLNEIFSVDSKSKPNGWDRFYARFPQSKGLIRISRTGIDPKKNVAILWLSHTGYYLAGRGQFYILRRQGNAWKVTNERFGPRFVS